MQPHPVWSEKKHFTVTTPGTILKVDFDDSTTAV